MRRTAATASGCTGVPMGLATEKAMRSRPGGSRTSSAKGRGGGATMKGSPATGPLWMSSASALSRTLREITPSLHAPNHTSPKPGPLEMRPREGFSANRPQQAAGMRSEPPPSLPEAMGTTPAATAAAEPPLEPPLVREGSQGLFTRPKARESLTALRPNSGMLVLAKITSPASSRRCSTAACTAGTMRCIERLP